MCVQGFLETKEGSITKLREQPKYHEDLKIKESKKLN